MVNLSPTPGMGSEDFAYMLQEKPEVIFGSEMEMEKVLA